MRNCDPETSVTDWVIDCPAALTVFQRLGIDSSGGGISLEYACRKKGLRVNHVLDEIEAALSQCSNHWASATRLRGTSKRVLQNASAATR